MRNCLHSARIASAVSRVSRSPIILSGQPNKGEQTGPQRIYEVFSGQETGDRDINSEFDILSIMLRRLR
jgi:hypothetical protein